MMFNLQKMFQTLPKLLASHHGLPGLIIGQSVWHLCLTRVAM